MNLDSRSSETPGGGDAKAPTPEPLPAARPAPGPKDSACLDDERALTDYADALDRLWQP